MGFAFDIHARHVGRWVGLSALVEPTDVVLHGMDVIHLDADGRATEIWAVNDQSDLLIPPARPVRPAADPCGEAQSSPRYAFRTSSLASSSWPVPSRTMLPTSRT